MFRWKSRVAAVSRDLRKSIFSLSVGIGLVLGIEIADDDDGDDDDDDDDREIMGCCCLLIQSPTSS